MTKPLKTDLIQFSYTGAEMFFSVCVFAFLKFVFICALHFDFKFNPTLKKKILLSL